MARERTTAPPALRVILRAALIAVLLGIGYLGFTKIRDASPGDARTLAKEAKAVPAPDPNARPVDQSVLQLGDLPRGWSAQAQDPAADDICEGRIPRSVIVPTDSASSAFTQGESGPFITNAVNAFADDGAAKAFMDLTARTVESCRQYEQQGSTIQLGALDFPRFGDQTFVAKVGGVSPYGKISGAIIYVRVGNRVTSLETIAFGSSTVSQELVEHLVQTVTNRI